MFHCFSFLNFFPWQGICHWFIPAELFNKEWMRVEEGVLDTLKDIFQYEITQLSPLSYIPD
jgi:hypothetical protein